MIGPQEKSAIIGLFPFLKEEFNVIDVGSNKGHFSDLFISEFKERGRVILFEPNDMLLNYTRIKYEYQPNIWYENRVAYSVSGRKVPFYYFENYNNELSSLYKGGEQWEGLPMKEVEKTTVSLDDYCDANSLQYIDYIKIDCEGADMDVLSGCRKLIAADRVGIIQVEYSEHWQRSGANFAMLQRLAAEFGYKIYRFIEDNFWEVKEEQPEYDNYFITKFEIHNFSVGGWNNNFLISTAELPKLDLVVEIGCCEGLTTKHICEKMLSDNTDARVIAVDPLRDYYVVDDPRYHPEFKHQYQRFLRNTRGLPIDLKRGESKDELPKLHALRADLVYVDGNHYAPWPYHDGCWAFAITKIGGYILFDDYDIWAEDTKSSIDKFLNEFSGNYEIVSKGYQILIRKTSNKYNELTYDYYK